MKKIAFLIIVIVSLIIIGNLIRSIYTIWQKKDYVTQAEKELSLQKQEHLRLRSELSYSQTLEYIEKEARDKLFMVKEGEQGVLVPEAVEQSAQEKKENLPNWKQWWKLFFE